MPKPICLVLITVLVLIAMVGTVIATTTTVIIYPDASRSVERYIDNTTYTNLRNGVGNILPTVGNTTTAPKFASNTVTDTWNSVDRGIHEYNTSTIPVGSTLVSANLSIFFSYSNSVNNTPSFGVTGGTLTYYNGTIVATDYNKYNQIEYIDRVAYSPAFTEARLNLSITNLSGINSTGQTVFFLRDSHDIDNVTPTWGMWSGGSAANYLLQYSVNNTDPAKRPYLEITYTDDTTPAASITGLGNDTSTTCGSVNFTWTNPVDSDYNHANVYENGVYYHTVSTPLNYDLWSGLSENTEYTISTQTVDNVGNVNTTWVNYTKTTPTCGALKEWPKIMFTFDDGSSTQLTLAYPILDEYNYNATSYVVTGSIYPAGAAPGGYLSVTNLTALYNEGWDISGHTVTHQDLTTLSQAGQVAQVEGAKQNISDWGFTRAMYHMSYPYGSYNDEVIASVKSAGILTARTSDVALLETPLTGDDLYKLPNRITIHNTTLVTDIETIISGATTNETVVILFHTIDDTPTDYEWTTTNLQTLVNWIHHNGYQPITITEWYSLNGGTPTPTPTTTYPISATPVQNNVVAALNITGIGLILAGISGIIYSLMSFSGGVGGRSSNYGGDGFNTSLLIGSISAILVGSITLVISYVIISPLLTMAGG